MGWIRDLTVQLRARNLTLVCPNCKGTPSRLSFERARFMRGEQTLTCEQCSKDSFITLWRFEGASQRQR
jgi:transposase-like protein